MEPEEAKNEFRDLNSKCRNTRHNVVPVQLESLHVRVRGTMGADLTQ